MINKIVQTFSFAELQTETNILGIDKSNKILNKELHK